uniref:Uncharacterized protein n=1 Tax=Romanomermis culicivorax TaxID=13658 RepID=A0A915KQJ7_ROMCU
MQQMQKNVPKYVKKLEEYIHNCAKNALLSYFGNNACCPQVWTGSTIMNHFIMINIKPIDEGGGPKAQEPACSQQAAENPLGDPI